MAAMIWDEQAQAWKEAETPLVYDPASGEFVETSGLVWDADAQAWEKVYPIDKEFYLYKRGEFPQGGAFIWKIVNNTAPSWDVHNDVANGYILAKSRGASTWGSSLELGYDIVLPIGTNGFVEKVEFVGAGRPYAWRTHISKDNNLMLTSTNKDFIKEILEHKSGVLTLDWKFDEPTTQDMYIFHDTPVSNSYGDMELHILEAYCY